MSFPWRLGTIPALACALAAGAPAGLLDLFPGGPAPFPAARPPRPPALPPEPSRPPGCDLIAAGAIMADLRDAVAGLKDETRDLKDDAERLWFQWRNQMGIIGAPPRWLRGGEESQRPFTQVWGEKLQADLYRLLTRATNADHAALALDARLSEAEGGWRYLRDLPEGEARRRLDSGSLFKTFSECAEDLKDIVAKTADVDKSIRDLQKDVDDSFASLSQFLNRQIGEDPGLKRPWHWSHLYTGVPREDFRYDVGERFETYRAQACKNLYPASAR